MESKGRLMEELKLENGLTVYLYDQSRPIAGDRYQVQLLIAIPLEIKESYFRDCPDPDKAYLSFTSAIGREISFQQEKIRNFIDAGLVEEMLETMKSSFLKINRVYLSHPSFAEKYVMKKYREWKEREPLLRLHAEAIRKIEG